MTARSLAAAAALLAVAACTQEPANSTTPDIGNAARAAQADIDSYAANNAAPDFTPPAAPTSAPPSQRAQAITPDDALGNGAAQVASNAATGAVDSGVPEGPANGAARR